MKMRDKRQFDNDQLLGELVRGYVSNRQDTKKKRSAAEEVFGWNTRNNRGEMDSDKTAVQNR